MRQSVTAYRYIVHGTGPLLNRVFMEPLLLITEPATVVPVFPVTVPVLAVIAAAYGKTAAVVPSLV